MKKSKQISRRKVSKLLGALQRIGNPVLETVAETSPVDYLIQRSHEEVLRTLASPGLRTRLEQIKMTIFLLAAAAIKIEDQLAPKEPKPKEVGPLIEKDTSNGGSR